jgi:basic membrane lipoprotein Med (substrate-binding protein (PBP1-ABC) superfamily)
MPADGQRAKAATRGQRLRGRRAGRSRAAALSRGWARAGAWWRDLSLRGRWLAGAGILATAAGLAAGLLAALSGSPTVGERPYLSFTGCLLTDSDGINAQPAAAAWAGLQEAAAATRMQAQYLAVPSTAPHGGAGAVPYLASLVTQHCGLVVAAGPVQAAAVASIARRIPAVRFVVIGGGASAPNVTVVSGSTAEVRSAVDSLAQAALASAG